MNTNSQSSSSTTSDGDDHDDDDRPLMVDGAMTKKKKKSKKPFGSSRAVFAQSSTAWSQRMDDHHYDYLLQTEDYSILKQQRPSSSSSQQRQQKQSQQQQSMRGYDAMSQQLQFYDTNGSQNSIHNLNPTDDSTKHTKYDTGADNSSSSISVNDLNISQNQLPPRLAPNAWKQRMTLLMRCYSLVLGSRLLQRGNCDDPRPVSLPRYPKLPPIVLRFRFFVNAFDAPAAVVPAIVSGAFQRTRTPPSRIP